MVADLIQELKTPGHRHLPDRPRHPRGDDTLRPGERHEERPAGRDRATSNDVTEDDILGMIILGKKPGEGRLMYLGLDLGTSGLKAVLIDEAERLVARGARAARRLAPARRLVGAGSGGLDRRGRGGARSSCDQRRSLSASRHRPLRADARRDPARRIRTEVLRPCILWNDTRARAEAAEMDADPDWRAIRATSSFPGSPRRSWPGCSRHETETFGKIAKVLLPKDYLRLWLTGEHVGEMSDAAGTAWLDTRRAGLVRRAAGKGPALSREHMPRLVEGSRGLRRPARRARPHAGGAARTCRSPAGAATTPPRPSVPGSSCRGRCLRLPRHVGRALRRHGRLPTRSRSGCPHLLPRLAGHMAPDGRDPGRNRCAELVRAAARAGTPPTLTQELGELRRPAGRLSCPISAASGRHTTMPRSAARSSAWNMPPTRRRPRARCSRGWRSPFATAAMRWRRPARRSSARWRSAAARGPTTGWRPSPRRLACRSTCRSPGITAPRSARRVSRRMAATGD